MFVVVAVMGNTRFRGLIETVLPVSCLAHVLVRLSLATRLEVAPTVVMVTTTLLAAHTPPSGGSIRGLHEVPSNAGARVEGSDGGGPVSSVSWGPDSFEAGLITSILFYTSLDKDLLFSK